MNIKTIKNLFDGLCRPVQLYLIISILSIISLFYQNYNDPQHYCIGIYKTKSFCNNKIYFLFKIIYIAIWLFILQKLCSKGYTIVSWLLVLLPIIGMFIIIGLLIIFLMKNNGQL